MATSKIKTTKAKELTIAERLELGAQQYKSFKAKQKAVPNYAARMKKADEEIDLWIQITLMRERAGMTQIDVAKRLGMTQSAISQLEKVGHEGYTVSTLRKLAEATDHRLVIKFEPKQHQHA